MAEPATHLTREQVESHIRIYRMTDNENTTACRALKDWLALDTALTEARERIAALEQRLTDLGDGTVATEFALAHQKALAAANDAPNEPTRVQRLVAERAERLRKEPDHE